jgi:ribosomal-protein-alanine N-acetyltransferase
VSILIRTARLEDAALLSELHRASFDEAWDEVSIRGILDRPGSCALLAGEAETQSQAFILVQCAAGESEILSLATLPSARRMGLASALLKAGAVQAARRGAREMFLEVADDNQAALSLYARAGFVVCGKRPGYYFRPHGPAIDAAILRANLPL